MAGRRKKKKKKASHHFRYEVTVYAIETQGVSFILFVSKESLSHINPAFVVMSFDVRHVWHVVNIAYSWHYWSQKLGKCRTISCFVYNVTHSYILGGMLFTVRKAQLHVSALNVGHLQVVQ